MPPVHFEIPQAVAGFELAPIKGLWSLIVPEATTNLFADPSFEATASLADWNNVSNCTITQPTTFQVKGIRSILVTPTGALTTVAVYNGFHPSTSGMAASTVHTFSWFQKGAGGDTFSVVVTISGTTVGSRTYTLTGGLDRFTFTFTSPASINTSASFTFTQTKASGQPYFFDCFQMEAKPYATQYVDGDQFNGSWVGTQQASPSTRAATAAYGRVLSLRDWFDYRITGYQGGGMPPINNLSTPYGLLGGEFYLRTVPQSRVVTLLGVVESRNLIEQQQKRQKLINALAPYNATQQAAPLYLQFQAVDACGQPTGNILEMPATYVGDMTGNETNQYLDTFSLQFKEYLPPSIKEFSDTATNLASPSAVTNTNQPLLVRNPDTGVWSGVTIALSAPVVVSALAAKNNQAYVGGSTATGGFAGSIDSNNNYTNFATAPNGGVLALLPSNTTGQLYAGGSFTTPFTYIMLWNGGAWATVSSGSLNNNVRALAYDQSGNIIAGGNFTAPASKVAKYNGSAWSAISANVISGGLAQVNAVAVGLDNTVYIGGDFTSPTNNIAKYNSATGNWVTLGTGGSNAAVDSLAIAPDGSLIAGFNGNGTVGGVTHHGVARWNGVSWQDLNPQAYSNVAYIFSLSVTAAGGIYASNGNPATFVYYNGSQWVTLDLSFYGGTYALNTPNILTTPNGKVYAGAGYVVGTSTYTPSATTSVNYTGTAPTYPIITITSTSADPIYQISNYTAGANIYLNYTMQVGEILTLNTDPRNLSFTSNYKGNILSQILTGSNLSGFALIPGTNYLTFFSTYSSSPTIAVQVRWRNTHWGFEAGVGT
jgi:hypothetical protein